MVITLEEKISKEQLEKIISLVESIGYAVTQVNTQEQSYLVGVGKADIDLRQVGHLPGVRDVHRVTDGYKLVSRKWKASNTKVQVKDGPAIEEGKLTLIAGPCSVESEQQIRDVAQHLKEQGVSLIRGGAFKPRTSPYSFRGHGFEGLKMFYNVAHEYGLSIVTEVVSASHIQEMYDFVDVYQVGTRNSQNFDLLHELGKVDKPVLLKRGMSGTLEELLQSAEYIFASGNERLMLCERGIRTFEKTYRNTLDLNAIPALKEKTHLPVIVDPSHGVGLRRWVEPMALAGVMAGGDGLIFEIHKYPTKAYSDAQQTLDFTESERLIRRARATAELRDSF